MEKIIIFFLTLLYDILKSIIVRIVFNKLGADKLLHRWLRHLLRRSKYRNDALTKKELSTLNVVDVVDSRVISNDAKKQIVDLIDEYGCISRQKEKDEIYNTTLSVDLESLFIALDPLFEHEVIPRLNPSYDNDRIACVAVLPVPRNKKSRMAIGFQIALEKCLSGLDIPIEIVTKSVLRKDIVLEGIAKTKEHERILILQPTSIDDPHLERSISYIKEKSVSEIAEILTLVDPISPPRSERNNSPKERVLIKLNLDN